MDITYCPWEPATYLIFSSNVPLLIHYSHFIAIFAALSISLLVFVNDPRRLLSRLFLIFSGLFSTWAFLDVVLWATNDPGVVMFSWAMQVLLEPLTFALAFYIFFLHLTGHLPRFATNLRFALLLLPLVLFLPTELNLEALLLSACESVEGPIAKYYSYLLNFFFIGNIIFLGATRIPHLVSPERRRTALYFGVGLVTFLLAFTSGNIISSFTDEWTYSQYGLFGMPVFASMIAYSIVRFNAFRVQIASAQILVVMLWAFVAALLFVELELARFIAGMTLVFTTVAGYLLILSVHHGIKQREQLEELTAQLAEANARLQELDKMKSEFVSIASHQLRSPLTAIRGYASMVLDGSCGKVSKDVKDAVGRVHEASGYMARSIEDYLNVSRIEAGNMHYEYERFDLKDAASKVVAELQPAAQERGLTLTFTSACTRECSVYADIGKVRQIIHNLVDNALKYTKEGSVIVTLEQVRNEEAAHISIKDTGVGMSSATIGGLFGKFVRTKDAQLINTSGAGLGLYIARKMMEEMGGSVTAESEGEGKGSTFHITVPLSKRGREAESMHAEQDTKTE